MAPKLRTLGFFRRLSNRRPLNASPKCTPVLVVCGLLSALLHPAAARAQSHFIWEGDNNNNWKNSANWFQVPGAGEVPDGTGDQVQFDNSANRFTVDVNGDVRDVGHFLVFDATQYRFFNGTVRLNGILQLFTQTVHFDTDFTLEQVNNSNWNLFEGGAILFDGQFTGSGNVQMNGPVTFNSANSYSGAFNINGDFGNVVLGNANALQNATVVINTDDGLNINGLDANVGALAGSGDLDIGSRKLTHGGNDRSTTYAGVVTGDGNSILLHDGTGTLTLTGGAIAAPSSVGTLRAGSGAVVVDGARIDLTRTDLSADTGALLARTGDIALQNAAHVRMAAGSFGLAQNATLTVTDGGTTLTGTRLDAAESPGSTGSIVVQNNASLDLTGSLIIGYQGNGDLNVLSGAEVIAEDLRLAVDSDSTGGALVTGSGSIMFLGHIHIDGASASAPGGTGTLLVEDGAAIQVGGLTQILNPSSSITVDGGTFSTGRLHTPNGATPTISISDPVAGSALRVGAGGADSTFNGAIQDAAGGPGSLLKVGAGTLTLTGNQTYTGGTLINGGTLQVGNGGATGTISGDVTNNGALAFNRSNDVTFSGLISGAGGLTKSGAGTLTLSQANTFSGTTNINEGAIRLSPGNVDALQNSTVSINTDNGLNVTADLVNANLGGLAGSGDLNTSLLTVSVGANHETTAYSGNLSGNGAFYKVGTGALTLSGANTFSGTTNINNGQIVLGDADALQDSTVNVNVDDGLNLNGIDANLGALEGEGTLDLGSTALAVGGNGASTTYSGVLSGAGGSGSLAKVGAGTLALTNANTYSGGTHLMEGTLVIGDNSALGSGVFTIEDGTAIRRNGAHTIQNDVVINGDFTNASSAAGSLTVTGDVDLGPGTRRITSVNEARLILRGVVSGSGGMTVGNRTSLAFLGGAANTYTGPTTVESGGALAVNSAVGKVPGELVIDSGGRVELNYNNALSVTPSVVNNGIIRSGVSSQVMNVLSGAGTIRIDDFENHNLTIGSGDYAGTIVDLDLGITRVFKTGSGTLTLSGANTHGRGAVIEGGLLLANNTAGSATGPGPVRINAGGALGGTGSVAGTVTVADGGSVMPGASAGTLSVGGAAFQSGSALRIEIGGTQAGIDHDQLAVNNTATIDPGATLDLSYTGEFAAFPGDSFMILTASTLNGEFDAINFPDAQAWFADYDTMNGVLTVGVCLDADSDGVCNDDDLCPGFDDKADADSDGAPDGCDACAAGAATGDTDADGTVDLDDYAKMAACINGPAGGLGLGCECFDFDADDDVDLLDAAEFQVLMQP